MRHFAAFSLLLLINLAAFAQEAPRTASEQFLNELSGSAEEGVGNLFRSNPDFSDRQPERLADIKAMANKQVADAGEMQGFELVSTDQVGESLVRLTYVAKYHRGPVVAQFTWYRSSERWSIIDLKLDGRPFAIQQLFND